MSRFEKMYPASESYWRAVILSGANAASYKFTLAKALLELASKGTTFIKLDGQVQLINATFLRA